MSNPAPPLDIRPGWVQYLFKFSWFNVHGGYELWRHNVEVTKALAALQPLYGKDNVEIVTWMDSGAGRGSQHEDHTALTTPSVKIQCEMVRS